MKSVSERVQDLVSSADVVGDRRDLRGLVDEVRAYERVFTAKTVHAAANGKFPHWPLQTWVVILCVLGTIGLNVFSAGGKWFAVETAASELKELRHEISGVREDLATVHGQVTAVTADVRQNREFVERRINELSATVTSAAEEARNTARATSMMLLGRGGRGGGQ